MFFLKSVEKLRKEKLKDARLELEQRTLQIEELNKWREMLAERVARLTEAVAADEAAAALLAASRPGGPRHRIGGQVPPFYPPSPPPTAIPKPDDTPVAVKA